MKTASLVDGGHRLPRDVELPAEFSGVRYPNCVNGLSCNLDLPRVQKPPLVDGLLSDQFGEHSAGVGPRDATSLEILANQTCPHVHFKIHLGLRDPAS